MQMRYLISKMMLYLETRFVYHVIDSGRSMASRLILLDTMSVFTRIAFFERDNDKYFSF